MPTVRLNKKAFERAVGKKLPRDRLKERISMLGTDLEEVTKNEIIVEVFPNRPDMLSEHGFARAFSSFIKHKTGLRSYTTKKSAYKVIITNKVKNVRPYTACAIVKGLRITKERLEEAIQLQEKLHTTFGRNRQKCAIGVYPADRMTFPITFTAEKPENIKFTPLDWKQPASAEDILKEHKAGKEYGHLLEGASLYPLFIDATNKVLSMPPIINSEEIGKVTTKTTDLFVECSGHHLPTLKKCLNIVVTTLSDMGGQVYEVTVVSPTQRFTTPNLQPETMALEREHVNKRLGLDLTMQHIKKLLEQMGYALQGNTVLIPPYRADIMHEVDIIEDIAIAYGYENFTPEIPNIATTGEEAPHEIFRRGIISILTSLGCLETNTNHLISEDNHSTKTNCPMDVVCIKNPLSEEYAILRSWMIPSLLEVLKRNKHNLYPQRICEAGTVFIKDPREETRVRESIRIACVIADTNATYTDIKQVLEAVFASLGIEAAYKRTTHPSFIEGRVARVAVRGKDLAYIGELSPNVLTNIGLEVPVVACELNASALYEMLKK